MPIKMALWRIEENGYKLRAMVLARPQPQTP